MHVLNYYDVYHWLVGILLSAGYKIYTMDMANRSKSLGFDDIRDFLDVSPEHLQP